MSGGSYDYAYVRVQDMAESLSGKDSNPRRRAFAKLLLKVSHAMKAIEWVDSCDWSAGDENGPIDECLKRADVFEAERENLEQAVESAKRTLAEFGGKV